MRRIILACFVLAPALPLWGQGPTPATDRIPGSTSTGLGAAPGLSEAEAFAPPSEGDKELGEQAILRRAPQRTPIKVGVLSDIWWSDNVTAGNDDAPASLGEEEGTYWSNHLQASWRPNLGEGLFLDSFVDQAFYFYDGKNLDFQATNLGLGVIKVFSDLDDLAVFARYEYLYTHADNPASSVLLGAPDDLNDHFHRFRVGTQKTIFTGPVDSAYVAADALLNLSVDPSSLERHEYSFLCGYQRKLFYRCDASLFYRAAWLDYLNSGRNDWSQAVGLELSYRLNENARLHGTLLYGNNDSNSPGGADDYEVFQGGLGMGLSFQF